MTKISKKNQYKILFNDINSVNNDILSHLYLPLIGSESYQLYNWLKSEYAIGVSCNDDFIQDHERIFLYLNLDESSFERSRIQLESFNLLQTFYDDIDHIFYYNLKKPLEVEQFINNIFLRDKLIEKIGRDEYEKTVLFLNPVVLDGIYENISYSLNDNINNDEQKHYILNSYKFDFNKLVSDFLKENVILNLNNDEHSLIESYFQTNKLTYDDLYVAVKDSLMSPSNGTKRFDVVVFQKIMQSKLHDGTKKDLYSEKNKIDLDINKRNADLFKKYDFNDTQKKDILDWYTHYEFKDFYFLIIKDLPSKNTIKAIDDLQKKYNLKNDIINLLTDYLIFRIGKWNLIYFKKVCQTLNNLNLVSSNDVLNYLISTNNKDKKTESINVYDDLSNSKKKTKKTDPKEFAFLND